jgi:hypothetical protein
MECRRGLWICLAVAVGVCVVGTYRTAEWTGQAMSNMTGEVIRGGRAAASAAGPFRYRPSEAERYVFRESARLGFDATVTNVSLLPQACAIWTSPNASTVSGNLRAFEDELDRYQKLVEEFKPLHADVRQLLLGSGGDPSACDRLELVSGGLGSIFAKSGLLSRGSSFGYVEPIIPPLRHPTFCRDKKRLLDWHYLVHDFAAFCRTITPASKTAFVDLGASLSFHEDTYEVPILDLIGEFRKFGFRFDHIYGYEITPTDPAHVVQALPDHIFGSYHWINVGVSDDPLSKTNPWNMIQQNFREEDFVVVKLDIDTPDLEQSLVGQLRTNPNISKLVDVFYFEHHVLLKELAPYWKTKMKSTVKDSMDLFVQLRELGIASHSWI